MTLLHCAFHECIACSWLITDSEQIHTTLGSSDKIILMGIILPFQFQTRVAMTENERDSDMK